MQPAPALYQLSRRQGGKDRAASHAVQASKGAQRGQRGNDGEETVKANLDIPELPAGAPSTHRLNRTVTGA